MSSHEVEQYDGDVFYDVVPTSPSLEQKLIEFDTKKEEEEEEDDDDIGPLTQRRKMPVWFYRCGELYKEFWDTHTKNAHQEQVKMFITDLGLNDETREWLTYFGNLDDKTTMKTNIVYLNRWRTKVIKNEKDVDNGCLSPLHHVGGMVNSFLDYMTDKKVTTRVVCCDLDRIIFIDTLKDIVAYCLEIAGIFDENTSSKLGPSFSAYAKRHWATYPPNVTSARVGAGSKKVAQKSASEWQFVLSDHARSVLKDIQPQIEETIGQSLVEMAGNYKIKVKKARKKKVSDIKHL